MKLLGIYEHTMEDTTICGGGDIKDVFQRSCITLKDGAWETTEDLQTLRCLFNEGYK